MSALTRGRPGDAAMLVYHWMTPFPTTVSPTTSLAAVREMVVMKGIRHLPVCEGERLVGIITDRDIRTALPSPAVSPSVWTLRLAECVQVDEVMTRWVITIAADAPIVEAVRLMLAHRIGALPVTSEGRLVGIISATDVMRAFAEVLEEKEEISHAGS
jgi:acetoin utilization protein AcuB